MIGSARRALRAGLACLLAMALAGCGTVFYPERRGQAATRLDADIVILDGLGLLFFLVPGVVAFAVDFATGAIYLPPGERSRVGRLFARAKLRKYELAGRDLPGILSLVEDRTGRRIDRAALCARPARPGEEVAALLSRPGLETGSGWRRVSGGLQRQLELLLGSGTTYARSERDPDARAGGKQS